MSEKGLTVHWPIGESGRLVEGCAYSIVNNQN